MADIAELGFVAHDDALARAEKRLLALPPAAEKAERATDKFNKKAEDGRNKLDRLASGASNATTLLLRFASGIAAAFSVAAIISFTNAWTDLNSRVEIATGSMGLGVVTMGRLSDMARTTYSSLEQTAETFLGNATALRELGKTTSETLNYVEAVNNALVVSGAKGQRAESVMNALNKAMALGKLSGDQLETVLASGGRVTEVLAEHLGVTTLELRKLGAEGKITGQVIYDAMTGNLEKLRAEADSMPATIGDAFVLLNNGMMRMIGTFDQARGASSAVASAIIMVADGMNSGAISVERLLSYATALAGLMAGSWVVSFVAANGATATLVATLGLLRGALIRTGIGALVVLAGELTFQLFKVVDGSRSVSEAFDRLKKSGVDTWERLEAGSQWFWLTLNGISISISAAFVKTWADIMNGFTGLMNGIKTAWNSVAGIIGQPLITDNFENNVLEQYMRSIDLKADAIDSLAAADAAWNRMIEDKSTSSGVGDGAGTFAAFASEMGVAARNAGYVAENIDKAGKKAAEAYAKITEGARQFIDAQRLEAQSLGMTTQQANALRYAQDLLNQATEGGKTVTAAQRNELLALASGMASAEAATVQLTETYKFGQSQLSSALSGLKQDLMAGTSLWTSLGNVASNVLDNIANKALEMASNSIWDMIFGSVMGGITGGGGLKLGYQSGVGGFSEGGYTGNGSRSAVAGAVHGQEFVLNAGATQRIGVDNLNAMNDNMPVNLGGNDGDTYVINFNPVQQISGMGLTMEQAQELIRISNTQMLDELPDVIADIQNDPRKRKVRAG